MTNTTPTQIRIDKDLKEQTSEIFSRLGLDMSSAVNVFLRQCVIRRGLPFKVEIPGYSTQTRPNTKKDQKIGDLSGWNKEVFNCLERIPHEKFILREVYKFIPELSLKYPNNHTIDAKIRQTLQQLRKLGYIEFLGNGLYHKLY